MKHEMKSSDVIWVNKTNINAASIWCVTKLQAEQTIIRCKFYEVFLGALFLIWHFNYVFPVALTYSPLWNFISDFISVLFSWKIITCFGIVRVPFGFCSFVILNKILNALCKSVQLSTVLFAPWIMHSLTAAVGVSTSQTDQTAKQTIMKAPKLV